MSKVKYVTPAANAQYPWLQPGRPDTAFDTEGKYKVNLMMPAAESKALVEMCNARRDEMFSGKDIATAKLPFTIDDETGDVTFKVQSKFQPKYFDAKGNPIPEAKVPLMYSGSTLKVSGVCEHYVNGANKGVAMRLGAVQVIDPVSNGGDSAGSFDAVEGYEVEASETADDYDF